MALTPLEVEVLNPDGSPAASATIQLRDEQRSDEETTVPVDGYNRDGSVMTPPILTDSAGAGVTWLPNSIVEWRSVGTVTSRWRAFRAYAGYGAEGIFADALGAPVSLDAPVPANGSPATLDTITVPSFGIDDAVGLVAVTVDFAFSNMWDLKLSIVNPSAGTTDLWSGRDLLSSSANDYAFDGQVTLVSEGGDDNYNTPMVDGGTYSSQAVAGRGAQASGVWTLTWEGANATLDFSGHTGELRGWSIEMVPD